MSDFAAARGFHRELFPVGITSNARPAFDLSIADRTGEAAGFGFRVLLFSRHVPHGAVWAFESFAGPRSTGHCWNMRPGEPVFHPVSLP